jgi:soluble lytic murein transglycosylase-like protein
MIPWIILGGLTVLIIGTFSMSKTTRGETVIVLKPEDKKPIPILPRIPLEASFRKIGLEKNVDWRLLAAIAKTESDFNSKAVNKDDNESLGLMQILCKPDGKGGCSNTLNLPEWKGITREKLFDVETNLRIGAGIIAENISRYGMPRAVAAYNRYAERLSPQYGPFKNQAYVNKVLQYFNQLQEKGYQ